MDSMPMALIVVSRVADHEAGSALPHAPVIHQVDKVSLVQRTRTVVAGGLRRAADVVAPPRPVVRRTTARSGLSREAG